MPDPDLIFQHEDYTGRLLEAVTDEDEGAHIRIYRAGASYSSYVVYLDPEELQRLQLALAAHLHRSG